jgi:hypothetical protein
LIEDTLYVHDQMSKSKDLDIDLTAHHYIAPKIGSSNSNFPHMAARAHMCETYSTIGAFKIGLGNHYLNFPLSFSLPCIKKSGWATIISIFPCHLLCPALRNRAQSLPFLPLFKSRSAHAQFVPSLGLFTPLPGEFRLYHNA